MESCAIAAAKADPTTVPAATLPFDDAEPTTNLCHDFTVKCIREKLEHVTDYTTREHWEHAAERLVHQYCRIFAKPDSAASLKDELSSTALAMTRGELKSHLLFHYDQKLSGEPQSNPTNRICPFQEHYYK